MLEEVELRDETFELRALKLTVPEERVVSEVELASDDGAAVDAEFGADVVEME